MEELPMIEILIRKFKKHSRMPITEIKRQQAKHKKDLIQPRIGGELNPEFLEIYGAKNINISKDDIRKMEKKNLKFAKKLIDFKKQQINGNKN